MADNRKSENAGLYNCWGCMGAAFGDCDRCEKIKGEVENEGERLPETAEEN